MSTIGNAPLRLAGPAYGGGGGVSHAGGAGATGGVAGYFGQGAGTTGQVSNGFSQFIQGGSQLLGMQGAGGDSGGSSGGGEGGSIPPMPTFKSPILERSKSQQNESANKSSNDGRDSSGWKRTKTINDDDGEGGGGEE